MPRILVWSLAFALAFFPTLAGAQSPVHAFPPGTFQSRGAIDAAGGGGVTFTGVGDLSLSGSVKAYWGLRAYTSATRGNKLINACNSTGGVDVGCADMFSDATTGILASATISGITCPGANCTVKTIYDTSGQTNCTTACNLTQSNPVRRPTLGISGLNSLPCMQFTAASTQALISPTYTGTTAQPYTISYVAVRTGNTSAFNTIVDSDGLTQSGFDTSANHVFTYAGVSIVTASASDNAFHAVQNILNGASSVIYVDGSSNSVSTGTNAIGTTLALGARADLTNASTACVTEASLWSGAFSGGDNSAINTNQHGTSGWNF